MPKAVAVSALVCLDFGMCKAPALPEVVPVVCKVTQGCEVQAHVWCWQLLMGRPLGVQSAEQTPLTALRIGDLAMQAGLPAGALNILSGPPPPNQHARTYTPARSRARAPAFPQSW